MSFVSFWKNTKNVICLFLEKNSKLNVFEKQVNLDLTLFGKKQKMSFVSFWNEPNVAAALMSTHFASVPDGRVRTVSKGECCGSPMLVTTTVGQSAPASSFRINLPFSFHGFAPSGGAQSTLSTSSPSSKRCNHVIIHRKSNLKMR